MARRKNSFVGLLFAVAISLMLRDLIKGQSYNFLHFNYASIQNRRLHLYDANKTNTVLYVGVTSDLFQRVLEHKGHKHPGSFTAKYNCEKLVYYYQYSTIAEAILEEKRIKGRNRKYKESLVAELNPEWRDLWEEVKLW